MLTAGGRVQAVDLQLEMQRSYLDYAMSVIVGRALPEVRDGLKPVHRRVLYAMYDGGYRPDRGYNKCSRVVGDVMGQYHPHGDSAIYDTLVRMAQPWSLRYPLVDGQGNFGSPGNDPAAAMRYCVTGDTRVRLADGRYAEDRGDRAGRAAEQRQRRRPEGRRSQRRPVNRATKLFHSGQQKTLRLKTRKGFELTGSTNHPVLCLEHIAGVPILLWKRLDEISAGRLRGDVRGSASMSTTRTSATSTWPGSWEPSSARAGSARSGLASTTSMRNGSRPVLDVYDRLVGGPRYVARRTIASGIFAA